MTAKKILSRSELRAMLSRHVISKTAIIAAAVISCGFLVARAAESRQPNLAPADTSATDAKLLDDFIKARGYGPSIVFDSSNIKQFWVDKSVLSRDGSIRIALTNGLNSVPLKIQLVNVYESQDCKVDVISDSPGVDFSVTSSKNKTLSTSSAEDPFIHYHVASSTFHLEDTPDFTFNFIFSSKTDDSISIKKIILSFPDNKNSIFLFAPGKLTINKEDVTPNSVTTLSSNQFEITGKQSLVTFKKNLIITDNPLTTTVTIKNIGNTPTRIYTGFRIYSKNKTSINKKNYPFKNINKVLTVVSSEAESDKIIVDSYPQWEKRCNLAVNAKEDLSDIPNTNFVDGTIVEVKELPDGMAEIIMNKPLKTALEKGSHVRIHETDALYIYTQIIILQPGEEEVLSSSISKNDKPLQYSDNTLPRETYFVKPIILSYSVKANEENTILISDYSISY